MQIVVKQHVTRKFDLSHGGIFLVYLNLTRDLVPSTFLDKEVPNFAKVSRFDTSLALDTHPLLMARLWR